jgi:glycosyltransferase involved in cell wall biosynthesis
VICTRTPVLEEYLTDGEEIVYVPPRDVQALRGAITSLAHDAERRTRIQHNARRRARGEYGMENFVRGLIGTLQG